GTEISFGFVLQFFVRSSAFRRPFFQAHPQAQKLRLKAELRTLTFRSRIIANSTLALFCKIIDCRVCRTVAHCESVLFPFSAASAGPSARRFIPEVACARDLLHARRNRSHLPFRMSPESIPYRSATRRPEHRLANA